MIEKLNIALKWARTELEKTASLKHKNIENYNKALERYNKVKEKLDNEMKNWIEKL